MTSKQFKKSFILKTDVIDDQVRSKRSNSDYYDYYDYYETDSFCDSDYEFCHKDDIMYGYDYIIYKYDQECSENVCKVSKWISDDEPDFTGDHENFV